jgi:RNA polymerase sigma-70 factor (sigma-E family)
MTTEEAVSRDAAVQEFSDFFDRYSSGLARLAYLLLGNADAADDLTSDVFLAVWQQWPRIRELDCPLAYVRRMFANQAATRHRKRSRESSTLQRLFSSFTREVQYQPDMAAVLDVREALDAIPPRRRACIVLRYAFDLSEQEVADVLGISVGAVKSQSSKGMAQLRRDMDSLTEHEVAVLTRQSRAGYLGGVPRAE